MAEQLTLFNKQGSPKDKLKVVNIASVPQRSPFRFPGGKTWLVPVVRKWLNQSKVKKHLCEPFAGGGIVSLTAAFENLAEKITMIELDEDVAAVWEVIINGDVEWLANTIFKFEFTRENVNKVLAKENKNLQEAAFATILKNRVFHGGIITKGAGLIKNGENGKGLGSRWYPKTLYDRILSVKYVRNKIQFVKGDAFAYFENSKDETSAFFFIDPPYTKAGRRLYTHSDIDHDRLFEVTSEIKGKFMLTYDDADEIRLLADKYGLAYKTIPMKTTHHIQKNELIISDNFDWWD